MAGNYYGLNQTKLLLNIDITDTAEDEILNSFGAVANQHIDNIQTQHDERIPLKAPNVLADIKMAANCYVASLFRGKRGDTEVAEFWMNEHQKIIDGIINKLAIDGQPQVVERFTGRRFNGDAHYLAEW